MDAIDLMPKDTPRYMAPAWYACLKFVMGKPELMEQFRQDTGIHKWPSTNPLESMIDNATGLNETHFRTFVDWVNVNVWGDMTTNPDDLEGADA